MPTPNHGYSAIIGTALVVTGMIHGCAYLLSAQNNHYRTVGVR